MLERCALAGKSLPACPCAGCASMPARSWRRLALRARRRWRGRCAPGACGEPDFHLAQRALGARRTALRAEGAARLCAGPPRAAQPMAWALRAWAPIRQPGRGLALRARRRWRRRCTPERLHVLPPHNARVASWWWGGRRRRALCADRDAWCKARFALGSCRGRG
jgi:hypothetical protein